MIPVRQTKRGGPDLPPEERGDCMPACIASVLEVPIELVGNDHHAAPHWFAAITETCRELGFEFVSINPSYPPPQCLWLAGVPSLNLKPASLGHCIVALGDRIIWDPGIGERRYRPGDQLDLETVTDGWVLVNRTEQRAR